MIAQGKGAASVPFPFTKTRRHRRTARVRRHKPRRVSAATLAAAVSIAAGTWLKLASDAPGARETTPG